MIFRTREISHMIFLHTEAEAGHGKLLSEVGESRTKPVDAEGGYSSFGIAGEIASVCRSVSVALRV